MNVPFLDLRAMHEEVRRDIEAGWRDLIDRSAFVGGAAVSDFERRFAEFCRAEHCVGVASGTDAVRIALQAVGVEPGDLVVTVPHTFIATVEGVAQLGAAPVFVDIDPSSYTMDPNQVADYLGRCEARGGRLFDRASKRRVSCLLPVHLYGQPADMDALRELADRYELKLVEDAAQAHGAEYRGRRCGSLGDAAAFSFYPGKNLGAMGEAGAVTTHDARMAEQCRILREHGQRERYIHVRADGGNGRLDAVQAVALSAKLPRVEGWNERRRQIARRYGERLADLNLVVPREAAYARHVYHLYVVLVEGRDEVRKLLEARGVGTGLHYPVPLHLQTAYADLRIPRGTFPVSERVAATCFSLPMFPHATEEQVDYVVAAMEAALAGEGAGAGAPGRS